MPMTMNNAELWVDKYRPTKLDDYVLNADIKEYFKAMIERKSLQNFTLAGTQGMGKTTLARLLAKEFGAETLFVKCATDGTLDVLRTKITEFCNVMSMDGKVKIVILDELDSASSGSTNNFQLGLRTTIEAAQDDTRFLCTANYATKIVPAILSRCPIIPLKFDKRDLLQRVKVILDAEKVGYDKESLKAFIEEAFGFYPDIRRIVNYLQFCCASGKLVVKLNQVADSGKEKFLEDLMSRVTGNGDPLDFRRFYLGNKEQVSDFTAFGSDVFNWAVDKGLVDDEGVLRLADMLYQLNVVVDKEPTVYGMLVAIRKYAKKAA